MKWLEFIAEMTAAVAWPGVAVTALLVLRKPLLSLVPLLQRVKYGEFEAEFGAEVRELAAEVAKADLPAPGAVPGAIVTTEVDGEIARLAEVSPRAAVLESWRTVEVGLLRAMPNVASSRSGQPVAAIHAIRVLQQHRLLDQGIVGLLHELRSLRNQAAHAPEFAVTVSTALEYAAAAKRVASHLDTIRMSA